MRATCGGGRGGGEAEVRKETGRGKNQFKIRALFADGRRLASMERRIPDTAEGGMSRAICPRGKVREREEKAEERRQEPEEMRTELLGVRRGRQSLTAKVQIEKKECGILQPASDGLGTCRNSTTSYVKPIKYYFFMSLGGDRQHLGESPPFFDSSRSVIDSSYSCILRATE